MTNKVKSEEGKITDVAAPSEKPLCFVIGPIGQIGSAERRHADFLLYGVIKHVLESKEFDYHVKRADEDSDPGMIGDRMIVDIINANLVVADLTDLNPNAFYELGIRHSTLKPAIHIAKAGTKLPFDNIAYRTIMIDITDWANIESARVRLANSVRATLANTYQVSNPITQARAGFAMQESADPRDQLIAEIRERLPQVTNKQDNPRKDPRTYRAFINALVAKDLDSAVDIYSEVMKIEKEEAQKFIFGIRRLSDEELKILYKEQAKASDESGSSVVKQVKAALIDSKNLNEQSDET